MRIAHVHVQCTLLKKTTGFCSSRSYYSMSPGARDARQPEPLGPADGRDVGRQAEQHAAEGLH